MSFIHIQFLIIVYSAISMYWSTYVHVVVLVSCVSETCQVFACETSGRTRCAEVRVGGLYTAEIESPVI